MLYKQKTNQIEAHQWPWKDEKLVPDEFRKYAEVDMASRTDEERKLSQDCWVVKKNGTISMLTKEEFESFYDQTSGI